MINIFAYLNNNDFLKSMFVADTTFHNFCKSQIEYLTVAFDFCSVLWGLVVSQKCFLETGVKIKCFKSFLVHKFSCCSIGVDQMHFVQKLISFLFYQ